MNQGESRRHQEHEVQEAGFPLVPDLRREKRALNLGEAGQLAPGGHYNQKGANAPGRSRLDEAPPDQQIEQHGEKKRT